MRWANGRLAGYTALNRATNEEPERSCLSEL
jgi:hypothetical protein